MTPAELLKELATRKVELQVEGGRLRFRAPTGAVSKELRDAVAAHRSDIIANLCLQQSNSSVRSICTHIDPLNWIDEPRRDGRIRTTCRICGRFFGYRPADLKDSRKPA